MEIDKETYIHNMDYLYKISLWLLRKYGDELFKKFGIDKNDISAILDIVKSLGGDIKYTLLPFHNICEGKYVSQGKTFPAANLPEPTKEQMAILTEVIERG